MCAPPPFSLSRPLSRYPVVLKVYRMAETEWEIVRNVHEPPNYGKPEQKWVGSLVARFRVMPSKWGHHESSIRADVRLHGGKPGVTAHWMEANVLQPKGYPTKGLFPCLVVWLQGHLRYRVRLVNNPWGKDDFPGVTKLHASHANNPGGELQVVRDHFITHHTFNKTQATAAIAAWQKTKSAFTGVPRVLEWPAGACGKLHRHF